MSTSEERIEQVRNDREHGSRWLVRETLLILRDLARAPGGSAGEQRRRLYAAGRSLAQARPSMAALGSAVGRVLAVQGDSDAIAREAESMLQEYDTATMRITEHAQPFVHGTIMTCSISGTVLDVLVACRHAIQQVIVTEGRPRYEGRDLARVLGRHGMTVTLITDAQADIFMPMCDSVIVGADSVLANGDVLNKAGTALLAWSAQGYHVPFYVLCETLKISWQQWLDDTGHRQIHLLEEKEGSEVLEESIDGVTVRNFYFDRTPYKLVSKVITEQGVLEEKEIAKIAQQVQRNRALLALA